MSWKDRRRFDGYNTAYVTTKDGNKHTFATICAGHIKKEGSTFDMLFTKGVK